MAGHSPYAGLAVDEQLPVLVGHVPDIHEVQVAHRPRNPGYAPHAALLPRRHAVVDGEQVDDDERRLERLERGCRRQVQRRAARNGVVQLAKDVLLGEAQQRARDEDVVEGRAAKGALDDEAEEQRPGRRGAERGHVHNGEVDVAETEKGGGEALQVGRGEGGADGVQAKGLAVGRVAGGELVVQVVQGVDEMQGCVFHAVRAGRGRAEAGDGGIQHVGVVERQHVDVLGVVNVEHDIVEHGSVVPRAELHQIGRIRGCVCLVAGAGLVGEEAHVWDALRHGARVIGHVLQHRGRAWVDEVLDPGHALVSGVRLRDSISWTDVAAGGELRRHLCVFWRG